MHCIIDGHPSPFDGTEHRDSWLSDPSAGLPGAGLPGGIKDLVPGAPVITNPTALQPCTHRRLPVLHRPRILLPSLAPDRLSMISGRPILPPSYLRQRTHGSNLNENERLALTEMNGSNWNETNDSNKIQTLV